MKRFLILTLLLVGLTGCNTSGSVVSPDLLSEENIEATADVPFKNTYLCVTINTGGQSELVKILNLETKELTSLPVPGFVQGMSADVKQNVVYVNSKTPDGSNYSLFKLDIKNKQVTRILSFSQLGIKPTYFIVRENIVYVTGTRGGVGTFYGNDLLKNEWFAVANNVSPGKVIKGTTEDTYHVISYDDEYVTRTIVDVKLRQIMGRKTISHNIPFGNNVFIPSPRGMFVYVLHQLQDSFIPYSFNLKQGTFSKFDEVQTNGGLLYSAIVSKDGKNLFTNVDSTIYHYRLDGEGEKLVSLPNVKLTIPESRNMVMGADNKTLYVTHETGSNMSVVKFASDMEYTVTSMYVGGSSNQVYLF